MIEFFPIDLVGIVESMWPFELNEKLDVNTPPSTDISLFPDNSFRTHSKCDRWADFDVNDREKEIVILFCT